MTAPADRPPSPSPSQLPPVPASPTYSYASMSTAATTPAPNITMSSYNLPLPPPPPPAAHAVLTKSDLAASQSAYATLLTAAKTYRQALAALSTAASAFGSALEACARLKEARADSLALALAGSHTHPQQPTASSACTADSLLAAAGVQHLVANHKQILSETVYRSFEVPLLHELDKWRRDVDDEQSGYLAAVKKQSAEIRTLERDGLRLHKQRGPRDVGQFRRHLVALTTKLDGLTALHADHARTLLRESQDTSVKILEASCSLVRAEVDIFESLARKGWSGGGLDEILEKGTDLFAADDEQQQHWQHPQHPQHSQHHQPTGAGGVAGDGGAPLFSILPPKSILADTMSSSDATTAERLRGRSPTGNGLGQHRRADSLGVVSEPYQSLAGAITTTSPASGDAADGDADAASIFSAADLHHVGGRPRMTRPFSPQPVRVAPEDVMGSGGGGGSGGDDGDETTRRTAGFEAEASEDEESEAGPPSSPETIRDGFDEHPWDSEGEGKRMSTAASDPDERERRWHAEASEDETV